MVRKTFYVGFQTIECAYRGYAWTDLLSLFIVFMSNYDRLKFYFKNFLCVTINTGCLLQTSSKLTKHNHIQHFFSYLIHTLTVTHLWKLRHLFINWPENLQVFMILDKFSIENLVIAATNIMHLLPFPFVLFWTVAVYKMKWFAG